MEYSIKAIPTLYNGVRFRSRLEAKWAAFFDLCGWKWEYEPRFFPNWLPDFLIKGVAGPIYIEVKPIQFEKLKSWQKALFVAHEAAGKAFVAKEMGVEALVIGDRPFSAAFTQHQMAFGVYVNDLDPLNERATLPHGAWLTLDPDDWSMDFAASGTNRVSGLLPTPPSGEGELAMHRQIAKSIVIDHWTAHAMNKYAVAE